MTNLERVAQKWYSTIPMSLEEQKALTSNGDEEYIEQMLSILRHDVKTAEDAVLLENLSLLLRETARHIRDEENNYRLGLIYEKLFPITDPFSFVNLSEPVFSNGDKP